MRHKPLIRVKVHAHQEMSQTARGRHDTSGCAPFAPESAERTPNSWPQAMTVKAAMSRPQKTYPKSSTTPALPAGRKTSDSHSRPGRVQRSLADDWGKELPFAIQTQMIHLEKRGNGGPEKDVTARHTDYGSSG